MTDTTTPAAPKKGSSVAKILLLVILIVVAAFGGWNFCDSKTVEQGNAQRQAFAHQIDVIRDASNKNPVDAAALDGAHAALANIVAKNGGLFGPTFALRDDLVRFTGETKLNSAAILCVVSMLQGKPDQAEAEAKSFHEAQQQLAGVAGTSGGLDGMVGNVEKLTAELKKPGADQKAAIDMFRLGVAAGLSR